MEELVNACKSVPTSSALLPILRAAYRDQTTAVPNRLVGELYGLLTSTTPLDRNVRTVLTSLIREISRNIPVFLSNKFSSYSYDSLPYILSLFRELNGGTIPDANLGFLVDLLGDSNAPVPLRLEALSTLIHVKAITCGCADLIVADYLLIPATGGDGVKSTGSGLFKIVGGRGQRALEIDGSAVHDDIFTVLVHLNYHYSNDQLMHVGIFSRLFSFLKQRFGTCAAPPNTPVVSAPVSPSNQFVATTSSMFSAGHANLVQVLESVVALCVRILTQSHRDVSGTSIFEGKKNFKYVSSNGLVEWTREFVESTIVETLKCLDLVCRKDPSVVSVVFPHVRKVYERVLLREDSPGIALVETIKFFLSHSHMVIFDLEPVLRFLFTRHIAKRLLEPRQHRVILAAETVVFLNQFGNRLCTSYGELVSEHLTVLLRLAAWYPRTVGPQILEFIANQISPPVSLLHGVLDLPLLSAMNELSFSIDSYVMDPAAVDNPSGTGENQFVLARIAMRIIRSLEFKEIKDYMEKGGCWMGNGSKTGSLLVDLWRGIPITPRVYAAARLVPQLLSVLFNNESISKSECLTAVLSRYGPGRIFQFKATAGDGVGPVLTRFVNDALRDELVLISNREDIVTAIVDRLGDSQCEDFLVSLVHRIGRIESEVECLKALPLFARMLRCILLDRPAPVVEELDIVCIKNGRVIQKPSDHHQLLDSDVPTRNLQVSVELKCVVVTALTRLAVRFPQYRPQTIALFLESSIALDKELVIKERIDESLNILKFFGFSRQLLLS